MWLFSRPPSRAPFPRTSCLHLAWPAGSSPAFAAKTAGFASLWPGDMSSVIDAGVNCMHKPKESPCCSAMACVQAHEGIHQQPGRQGAVQGGGGHQDRQGGRHPHCLSRGLRDPAGDLNACCSLPVQSCAPSLVALPSAWSAEAVPAAMYTVATLRLLAAGHLTVLPALLTASQCCAGLCSGHEGRHHQEAARRDCGAAPHVSRGVLHNVRARQGVQGRVTAYQHSNLSTGTSVFVSTSSFYRGMS